LFCVLEKQSEREMETNGEGGGGGGGEAERRGRSELGRLLEAIGSSEVRLILHATSQIPFPGPSPCPPYSVLPRVQFACPRPPGLEFVFFYTEQAAVSVEFGRGCQSEIGSGGF
jgi:hypothetical protein